MRIKFRFRKKLSSLIVILSGLLLAFDSKDRLNMPSQELEKIKDEMAKWAHKKGAGGASDALSLHLMREFSSNHPARTAKEVIAPITKSISNYLKLSAAKAALIESTANLSREESCIHGY